MEEFDLYIKSKIDSLAEVPGVEFNEKRVWLRIGLHGNWVFSILLVFLLTSSIATFFILDEGISEDAVLTVDNDDKLEYLTDSSSINVLRETTFTEDVNSQEIGIITKSGEDHVSNSKVDVSVPAHVEDEELKSLDRSKKFEEVSTISRQEDREEPTTHPKREGTDNIRNELSVNLNNGRYTLGVAQLRKLNNHFSLNYGIQFNRIQENPIFINDKLSRPIQSYQIRFPVVLGMISEKRKHSLIHSYMLD